MTPALASHVKRTKLMSTENDIRQRLQRLDRLRKLGLRRGARDLARPEPKPEPADAILPGEAVDTPFGPTWVRTVRCSLGRRPGLAAFLEAEPGALAALGQDPRLEALDPARAAFIDTETTGLSLGADTYTFLIGVGTFQGAEFVVQQYFMRHPGEERAQLHLVEEALGQCSGIVSFNGRAFDLPLIQGRFVLARVPFPLAGAPHLDLLPPARRIWRALHQSCSLGSLERNVLAFQRTAEDVPGWMIPDIYRAYYRTGIPSEMLARVFYHNLEDILSTAALGAHMTRLFRVADVEAEMTQLHPLECLSLARYYEELGWSDAGVAAYRAALDGLQSNSERAAALRGLGRLHKRLGRDDEAAALWEEWIGTLADADLTPYIELAKHHEWHTRDLAAARGWAAWALKIAEAWPEGPRREAVLTDLRHRLARLERKLAAHAA